MRQGASTTAEAVCFMRACEHLRPLGERILEDPFAQYFLGPLFRTVLPSARAHQLLTRTVQHVSPGLFTYIVARHRFMDDALLASLHQGITQVILLGAGYDARPWRFADQLRHVNLFAVDHPATAQYRAKMVSTHQAQFPSTHVKSVEMNFQTQCLKTQLTAAGFQEGEKTFVVWEGVSMYLTRAAIQKTLTTIKKMTAPQSELVMDFWFKLRPLSILAAINRVGSQALRILGEPITFGLPPEELSRFVLDFGFEVEDLVTPDALKSRYVHTPRHVYPAMYVAHLKTCNAKNSL